MTCQHLVRVGLLGQVGRFNAVDHAAYPRGARVVVRTARGLEVGEVLSSAEQAFGTEDGTLLRRVGVEDDLLLARLERNKEQAFDACVSLLAERGHAATLMDVEHLFDGESIYFYFLGDVTPEIETLTSDLAQQYEAKVKFREFAEAVAAGCGPDCGTEGASGCGGGCSTCAVASACGGGPSK